MGFAISMHKLNHYFKEYVSRKSNVEAFFFKKKKKGLVCDG